MHITTSVESSIHLPPTCQKWSVVCLFHNSYVSDDKRKICPVCLFVGIRWNFIFMNISLQYIYPSNFCLKALLSYIHEIKLSNKACLLIKSTCISFFIIVDSLLLLQKWSQELADIARNHAQKCVFAHNGQRSAQSTTFTYVGENIYIGPGKVLSIHCSFLLLFLFFLIKIVKKLESK